VFDSGNGKLARQAYELLFTVFALQDDYGRGVNASDLQALDLGKTHARYLRAVYETEPLESRPPILFDAMARLRAQSWGQAPRLTDLLKITRRKLSDREAFLDAWVRFLRSQEGPEADALLREAIRLQGGAAALAEFARAEGKKHPRAYLDWVAVLRKEGRSQEALVAAEEALARLPRHLPLRAAVADHLCAAAERLRNRKKVQEGRWEAFAAWPSLTRLLDLLDVTPADQRSQRLSAAEKHLKEYLERDSRPARRSMNPLEEDDGDQEGWISVLVLAHAHLLNGHWEAARSLAGRRQSLGSIYADDPQQLVVPAFLVLVLGSGANLPHHVAGLWKEALNGSPFGSSGEGNHRTRRLERAYAQLVKDRPVTPAEAKRLLAWCVDITERRVAAIVKNQRRNSYDKAAQLVAACVEVFQARGLEAERSALIDRVREAYPRHRAFQEELNRAVGKSTGG
jgi:hypothetical protein